MTEPTLNQIFDRLVQESHTFAAARANRIVLTKRRILHTKLENKRREVIVGSLERHHRAALVVTQVCAECHGERDVVESIHVWSHSPLKGIDAAEITNTIRAKGTYDFNRDIPLCIHRTRTEIPVCADCLDKEYAAQSH